MQPTPATTQEIVHENTLFAEPLFHIGRFEVTNALVTGWVSVIIIALFAWTIRRKMQKVPGKLQHIFEVIIDGALSLCDQVTGNRKISEKVFPYVFAIFFFVLVNNWLGILPGAGSIGFIQTEHGVSTFVPLLRGGTADINTTLSLALMSVIGANIFGILAIGVWKTLNKYVNLRVLGSIFTDVRKDPTILIVAPIKFFVGLLEAIGEVAKVISLSFRLFGNAFAGEVLLASMAALVQYIVPAPFLFLEVFVGLIQALIFALLSLVYFTIAAEDHDEHEEHAPAH